MVRFSDWLGNQSFLRKMVLLIFLSGILPLSLAALFSVTTLKTNVEEKQLVMLNNSFEQVLLSLNEKLGRVHNISTLITINDTIAETITLNADRMANPLEQLSDFDYVSAYTQEVEMSHSGISVSYYIADAFLITQGKNTRYHPLSGAVDTDWGKKVQGNLGRPTWVAPGSLQSLALARYLWNHEDYSKSLGILLIGIDAELVHSAIVSLLPDQQVAIVSKSGEVLIGSLPISPAQLKVTGDSFIKADSNFLRVSPIEGTDLSLVSILPEGVLYQEVNETLMGMIFLYGIIFLAMILLLIPYIRNMTKRISMLGRQIAATKSDGLKKLEAPPYQDEIGRLTDAYNGMVDEMHRMLDAQYDLGRQKASAELKALQSQINPHFLYNTLDMVSWMAQKNEGENIQEVMQALSQFYKLTLSRGEDIISLKEECDLCASYMRIQQLRWKGKIAFSLDVEPRLLSARLPKITLQPFVENAIIHGIAPRGEPHGSIIISGLEDESGEYMVLSVVDDGVGIVGDEAQRETGKGSRYGFANIEKRLSLYFGEEIKIRLDSHPDWGTCVSIAVPIWTGGESAS